MVTGYKLRAALKEAELVRETVAASFDTTLRKFDDETKETPTDVDQKIRDAEKKIADLQAALVLYNTKVEVGVLGEKMTLAQAVKRLGGAQRTVVRWKHAVQVCQAADGRETSYRIVKKDEEIQYAKLTLSAADALIRATAAEKYAAALRGAIAEGNSTSVELGFDPTA